VRFLTQRGAFLGGLPAQRRDLVVMVGAGLFQLGA
jgi:hypothetical protein